MRGPPATSNSRAGTAAPLAAASLPSHQPKLIAQPLCPKLSVCPRVPQCVKRAIFCILFEASLSCSLELILFERIAGPPSVFC